MLDERVDKTFNLRFPSACAHLLVGPSTSGKTVRAAQIIRLKNQIIDDGHLIKNVVWCYAAWQDAYQKLKDENAVTKWINSMPSNEEFIELVSPFKDIGGSIVVIDDFMSEIGHDLDEIVRVTSRHYNVSTFILFQSLFPSQRIARQISLNVKFFHIHKNPRENSQIQFLARQIAPQSWRWIVDVYNAVTSQPYTSLLIDLTQERHSSLRFRSHYLPHEFPMRVWFSKSKPPSFVSIQ